MLDLRDEGRNTQKFGFGEQRRKQRASLLKEALLLLDISEMCCAQQRRNGLHWLQLGLGQSLHSHCGGINLVLNYQL